MRRGLVGLVLVLAAVLCIWGVASAANRVEVKVTSEPIAYRAKCDKAGALTFEWDAGSVIAAGDQITIDLPYGVKLCKDYKFYIAPSANEYYDDKDDLGDQLRAGGSQNVTFGGGGIRFRVQGVQGSQRVIIDVEGNVTASANLTVGSDATVILYLFDQNASGNHTWKVSTTGNWIRLPNEENTLCIDVSGYEGYSVKASLDSKGDKFTFIPSDPQVAHVVEATTYSWYSSKRCPESLEACVEIPQAQFSADCKIKTELKHAIKAFPRFENVNYVLEATITGDAYWGGNETAVFSGSVVQYETADCTPTTSNITGTVYAADGVTVITSFNNGDCDVKPQQKGKILKVTLSGLEQSELLYFKLPALVFDRDEVTDGETAQVRVVLKRKGACGETDLLSKTFVITFRKVCGPTGPQQCTLIFPYTTAWAAGDGWWDGMAIVNLGDTQMSCTMTIFENDGDKGTLSFTVEPHKMWVNLLSNVVSRVTPVSGTIGNDRTYVVVECDGVCDGFYMTGNGYEAQGYLPRIYMGMD